jgi:thioredoxin 1
MPYAKMSSLTKPEDETPKQPKKTHVFQIKNKQDKHNAIHHNRLCVIDVYGEWCGPCKAVAPDYEKLAEKFNISGAGLCLLASEDVDLDLTGEEVRGVPTFLFYKDGNLVHTILSANIKAVEEKIKELLVNMRDEMYKK